MHKFKPRIEEPIEELWRYWRNWESSSDFEEKCVWKWKLVRISSVFEKSTCFDFEFVLFPLVVLRFSLKFYYCKQFWPLHVWFRKLYVLNLYVWFDFHRNYWFVVSTRFLWKQVIECEVSKMTKELVELFLNYHYTNKMLLDPVDEM